MVPCDMGDIRKRDHYFTGVIFTQEHKLVGRFVYRLDQEERFRRTILPM